MATGTQLPIVAIVGRPNVGKSTLFNRYAGRRRVLVEGEPGITRDRVAEELRGRGTNLEDVRLEAFRRTLEHVSIRDDDLAAHLNAEYRRHRFEDMELFHDVLPALDALQGRYTLGLLTNGNTCPERAGLGGRFNSIPIRPPITSEAAGVT